MAENNDENMYGMLAHLSPLIISAISGGGLGFIGPLIIYMMRKEKNDKSVENAKNALNFFITFAIIAIICIVLSWLIIPIILLAIAGIIALIWSIMGSVKANNGEVYKYPICINFIK